MWAQFIHAISINTMAYQYLMKCSSSTGYINFFSALVVDFLKGGKGSSITPAGQKHRPLMQPNETRLARHWPVRCRRLCTLHGYFTPAHIASFKWSAKSASTIKIVNQFVQFSRLSVQSARPVFPFYPGCVHRVVRIYMNIIVGIFSGY